jgi:aryl-alcohol dehydrogenase-like predicted oxidoreductase
MTMTRTLGRGGRTVSALGFGCWAIGGPWQSNGQPAGWGQVDDQESVAAIRRAVELGVSLFDTADVYGCGHSERVLGQALAGVRDQVAVATKFGLVFDEQLRTSSGTDVSPDYIRRACEASLRRLGTDRIDLYQLHPGEVDAAAAGPVLATLDELVAEGKIVHYGTSVETPEMVRAFAAGASCVAAQQQFNVFGGNLETLELCRRLGLASLGRSPLAMGLLTGKYRPGQRLGADDVRVATPYWDYFKPGHMEAWLERVAAIREVLTTGGRSLAQGALAWLWARSAILIPIPGFRTVAQAEENAGAMALGPLTDQQMGEVDALLHGQAQP